MEKNNSEFQIVRRTFKKFGTEIDFQIVASGQAQILKAQKNLEQAQEKCVEIEKIFSRFDSASELAKINSQLGVSVPASKQMLQVAKLALEASEKTQGYFDPRIIGKLEEVGYAQSFEKISTAKLAEIGQAVDFKKELRKDLIVEDEKVIFYERMDFAGIVKGFATDQIATFFKDCGWQNFLVDCGGDMFFVGKDQNANPWYIDIEGIAYQNLMLRLDGQGVATSGIGKRKWEIEGKRFHHLVNPKKPEQFAFDLKSVTVVAASTGEADVWAKTLFVMGFSEAKKTAEEKALACAILDYRGGAWISTELKSYLY